MTKKLRQLNQEFDSKAQKLHQVFAEAGNELDFSKVNCLGEKLSTEEKAAKVREMNAELTDVKKRRDEQAELEKIGDEAKKAAAEADEPDPEKKHTHPGAGSPEDTPKQIKSIGRQFVESPAFKAFQEQKQMNLPSLVGESVSLKALMETTAGWAPETTRIGMVVPFATRPIQVIDIVPMGNTGQAAVVYMEETTFTNAAAETAEGGAYPEAALELTEKSSPVRKIAVWLPVTDEQLEDVAQVESYIDSRLRFMLRQRLDGQILNGNGVAPNLEGILNKSGIQAQAKGADPVPDAIYKAMTKIRVVGRAMPSVVVLHPNDWQGIRLLRTADGVYIWGNPSEAGPERIWGLPVAQTDAEPEDTGLVGDFANFIQLAERRGIEMQVTNSHSDYFINGKQAIRADMRAALPIWRPAAFCTATGI